MLDNMFIGGQSALAANEHVIKHSLSSISDICYDETRSRLGRKTFWPQGQHFGLDTSIISFAKCLWAQIFCRLRDSPCPVKENFLPALGQFELLLGMPLDSCWNLKATLKHVDLALAIS